MAKQIRRLFVANRGEIAVRVIKACRTLGIQVVVGVSEADVESMAAHLADAFETIGPGPAAASYLDIDLVIAAARRAGCDALHPGYGFLSERPALARACADAGITFVGPSPEAIEKMARVASARLVNLAGRQRMLSQRMAKNYFLVAAKADSKLVLAQLAADATDFRQAMQSLVAAPVSTPAIRGELELAASQWVFFESALRRPADEQGMSAVATTSERLLSVMDRLTGLYEAALREVLG